MQQSELGGRPSRNSAIQHYPGEPKEMTHYFKDSGVRAFLITPPVDVDGTGDWVNGYVRVVLEGSLSMHRAKLTDLVRI